MRVTERKKERAAPMFSVSVIWFAVLRFLRFNMFVLLLLKQGLTVEPRLVSNLGSYHLSHLSARIIGVSPVLCSIYGMYYT